MFFNIQWKSRLGNSGSSVTIKNAQVFFDLQYLPNGLIFWKQL